MGETVDAQPSSRQTRRRRELSYRKAVARRPTLNSWRAFLCDPIADGHPRRTELHTCAGRLRRLGEEWAEQAPCTSLLPKQGRGESGRGCARCRRASRTPARHIHLAVPLSAIQSRTSSARQAVTRGDSLTGAGNIPAVTWRHNVDFDTGTRASTCGRRTKPVGGRMGTRFTGAMSAEALRERGLDIPQLSQLS